MKNLIKCVHLSNILMKTNLHISTESFHANLILGNQIWFILEAGIKSFQCSIFELTDLFAILKVLIFQETHLTTKTIYFYVEVIELKTV